MRSSLCEVISEEEEDAGSEQEVRSSLCEVIVEEEEDSGSEQVSVQPQLVQLFVVVMDTVVAERLAHVEHGSFILPGVAVSMSVVAQVALQDLVQSLL